MFYWSIRYVFCVSNSIMCILTTMGVNIMLCWQKNATTWCCAESAVNWLVDWRSQISIEHDWSKWRQRGQLRPQCFKSWTWPVAFPCRCPHDSNGWGRNRRSSWSGTWLWHQRCLIRHPDQQSSSAGIHAPVRTTTGRHHRLNSPRSTDSSCSYRLCVAVMASLIVIFCGSVHIRAVIVATSLPWWQSQHVFDNNDLIASDVWVMDFWCDIQDGTKN